MTNYKNLILFDLDNTLLAGDSDYEWGQFLVEKNIVDREISEQKNKQFYEDYKRGELNIFDFLEFQLKPLSLFSLEQLANLHSEFFNKIIQPIMLPKAKSLIQNYLENSENLVVIITATNSFVTRPIANAFGIQHLIATDPEIFDGKYTGKVSGIPCFQAGKIERLHQWLESQNLNISQFENSVFYSDSRNDIPLLEIVKKPIAVNPDDYLRDFATQKSWEILDLRS